MSEKEVDKRTIVERAKKLLTLANNAGATLGEAENAMHLAQKLMLKYGLSLKDLHLEQVRQQVAQLDLKLNYAKFQGWHLPLMHCLQDAFDVKIIMSSCIDPEKKWGTEIKKMLILIGQDCDVEVAGYFFEFLNRDLYALAEADANRLGYSGARKTDYRTSFITGACETIGRRLADDRKEMMNMAEQEAIAEGHAGEPTGYAIVLVKKEQAIEQYVDEKFPALVTKRMAYGGRNASGHSRGQEAGRTMSLRKGMGGGGSIAGHLE